jgi:Arc/MetJ-type ribon-helix-helix transcriptional regulator
MKLDLAPETEKLIDDTVKAGKFPSAEAMVQAAIDKLLREYDEFAPGEFQRLVAVGTAELDRGEGLDASSVFSELRELSAIHRAGSVNTPT